MSFKLFAEVKPQSKKTNIEKISEQEYRIAVQAVPVAGKANQEVVELLARYFSVRRIIRESSSRSTSRKAGCDRLSGGAFALA